jgi:Holliday junction resolvase RusA-like endonuclease
VTVNGAPWLLARETTDPEVVASLVLPGNPAPKERPRHGQGHTFTPRKTRDAEETVAWTFRQARPDWQPDPVSAFGVAILFAASDFIRRDADNLLKLLLDALNKVVWQDDAQVVEFSVRLERGQPTGRTVAVLYRLPEPAPVPARPTPTRRGGRAAENLAALLP